MSYLSRLNYPFHFICYYLTWFAVLQLAAKDRGGVATMIAVMIVSLQCLWQSLVARKTQGLLFLILLFAGTGTLVDTVLLHLGVVTFASNPFSNWVSPPWMFMLWVSFAVLFYATLTSLLSRYKLLVLLGFLGFGLAYSLGVKMGAASFPHGYLFSDLVLGVCWSICLPFCCFIYLRTMQYEY